MFKIDYHADDYAVSLNASKRILELVEAGKLDSISIIPNMSCYRECMDYLNEKWDSLPQKPLVSIHIDLVDGLSLSGEYRASTWGKLFLRSYIPGIKRRTLKEKLVAEIKEQIKCVTEDLPKGVGLRLDSHMHTHMIPIVFDAMFEAVDELGMGSEIDFVRISKEPLAMFLNTEGIKGTFPLVNVVKNVILNILSGRCIRKLEKRSISYGYLWGLVMSGKMDKKRIDILAPKMIDYMKNLDMYLEVLCHPGIVLPEEDLKEYGVDDRNFLFSKNRDIEYEAAKNRTSL